MAALEELEPRALMAFSQLGFSLPELAISGEAGPRAAWGGVLDVSFYLQNLGTTTTTEPFAQAPATYATIPQSPYGNTSTADAPDSTVAIYASRSPRTVRGAVLVGTVSAPPVAQNSVEQMSDTLTLPSRPTGFPGAGGKIYLWFEANSTNAFPQQTRALNLSSPVPVMITGAALPELRALSLALPSSLEPGDTIIPQLQIENLGTADTNIQGPVTVDLVASVTRSFTLGSSIVASYTINNIPGVSQAPTRGNYKTFARMILNPPANVVSITGSAVTLPVSPRKYYLGVVIDPDGKISQLSLPRNSLELIRTVGPPTGLPPAGVVTTTPSEQFPNPPSGVPIGQQ